MRCPLGFDQSAELIVGYCARTLDPDNAAAFERHIDFCAECREAAAIQKAVWVALDEWRELPVSPDFDRRVFQRIPEAEKRGWWLWRHAAERLTRFTL
jgi:anti-sigma factor RsiW